MRSRATASPRNFCPTSSRISSQCSLRTTRPSRILFQKPIIPSTNHLFAKRTLTISSSFKMSDKFSNADTGDKPADPYKATNKDEPSELKEKVQDLVSFMKACKFAMMTTRIGETGMLVSRCMALAASVRTAFFKFRVTRFTD